MSMGFQGAGDKSITDSTWFVPIQAVPVSTCNFFDFCIGTELFNLLRDFVHIQNGLPVPVY